MSSAISKLSKPILELSKEVKDIEYWESLKEQALSDESIDFESMKFDELSDMMCVLTHYKTQINDEEMENRVQNAIHSIADYINDFEGVRDNLIDLFQVCLHVSKKRYALSSCSINSL